MCVLLTFLSPELKVSAVFGLGDTFFTFACRTLFIFVTSRRFTDRPHRDKPLGLQPTTSHSQGRGIQQA